MPAGKSRENRAGQSMPPDEERGSVAARYGMPVFTGMTVFLEL